MPRSNPQTKTLKTASAKAPPVSALALPQAVPHPLPEALVELIADRFRVLGEPMRIMLLDALRDGEATVGELQTATGSSQQNVSKHLGVLLRAGLIRRRKQGNFAVYEISDPDVFVLCEHVCGGIRRHLDELEGMLTSS
ncbi:MAG TPA: metalloregulator ArsR/SmtB family transcription factor [Solirubrobacteraceae bacterium]|jgi:DNA-binding transcriptional ArsR family regulator